MASSGTVEVRLEGGEELLKAIADADLSLRSVLRAATLAGGEVVANAAAGSAPGPGIVAEVLDASAAGVEVGIGPDKDHWYYKFIESGAAAHEISSKAAPFLRFDGQEGLVRTASVAHPGMAARPFLRPAHDSTLSEQSAVLGARLREALPT